MGEPIKSGRKKGFVVLFRSAAQDQRLSLEARGLFALMASLPENWSYTVAGLAGKAGCGRDKIRRLLEELQEVGYLVREQSHDGGGKFARNVYVLQDEAPLSGNTVNGETRQRETPLTENPPVKKKEEKEEREKKPPIAPHRGRTTKYDLAEDAKPLLLAYVGGDEELHRALGAFIQQRVTLRAVNSARAVRMLLSELDRLSEGRREDKLLLIQQSMANSWKSVFPLRRGGREAGAPVREEVETW